MIRALLVLVVAAALGLLAGLGVLLLAEPLALDVAHTLLRSHPQGPVLTPRLVRLMAWIVGLGVLLWCVADNTRSANRR